MEIAKTTAKTTLSTLYATEKQLTSKESNMHGGTALLQEIRRDILRYLGMPEAVTERSRTIEAEALLNREHDTLMVYIHVEKEDDKIRLVNLFNGIKEAMKEDTVF